MSKCRDQSSLEVSNTILRPKEDNLSLALTRLGVPYDLISQFLETDDTIFLFQHSQKPEFVKEIAELMKSSKLPFRLPVGGAVPKHHSRNAPDAMERTNDQILECKKELQNHYVHCSDVLKVPLLPSTTFKIHGVEDLHVPVILKKSEISADLPRMADLHAKSFFEGHHITKRRILLFGPPGVGKTTEMKMWLHGWCHNQENPLKKFQAVFYIDGAKLVPGTSLVEAVKSQCLPANTEFSSGDIERMCQECKDEVLVILDNYTKWRKKDHGSESASLEDMVLLRNFQLLTLLVATTSGGVGDFREVYSNYDHVKVEGISETSVSTYVNKVFKERKKFAMKVVKSLQDTKQVPDMAASPVLLSIMCQIVKWNKNPAVLGDLKTGSAYVDKLIDCVIKHGEDGDTQVRRYSDQPESPIDQAEDNPVSPEIEEVTTSAVQTLRGPASSARIPSLTSQSSMPDDSIPKDEILEQLSAVAFHCCLRNDHIEELQLSEDDFEVCGAQKIVVIKEGCRLGLLVKSCRDELTPSSPEAAEGRIIRFLCAPFQQRLAARHFSKLLQGNDEERQSFQSSLEKIGSLDDALSRRNLLLFSCGESRETARRIIGHVVDLTRAYAEDMFSDARHGEGILRQAHGLYQYMVEFILDLNYEARSGGSLNDILRPLVTRLSILSPTVIMTRALAYFLDHSATPQACNLGEVNIEVFDVQYEITNNLPMHKHIRYDYNENAAVMIEMSAFEDVPSDPDHPTLSKTTMRKLSIRVEGKKKKAIAAKFPAPPEDTRKKEPPLPFTEEAPPFTDDRGPPPGDGCLPVSVSSHHASGAVSGGRLRRVVEQIDRKCIKKGDFIDEGRFGEVYQATYEGKTYAMKRIKNVDDGKVSDVIREIKMNERVSHPNIVVLHAYAQYQKGPKSGYRFELLMDLIKGVTLEDALFEQKLQYLETPSEQIQLALKVSDAIAHMHANNCTHSDIKPNNIMIKIPGNEPYVCDLGSGHVVTQSAMSRVTTGKRYGVQRWMPPESSGQGYKVTYKGDIWSLACVLLEVFTRRKVWENFKDDKQLIARLSEEHVVPDFLSEVKDESIRDVLQRCFTKCKEDRPSATVFVRTFKKALDRV